MLLLFVHRFSFLTPRTYSARPFMSQPPRVQAPPLQSRFRCADRRLLFARATLHPDRIVLQGLSWRGRYREELPLLDIEAAGWWQTAEPGVPNFYLALRDGRRFALFLRKAGLWKVALQERGVDVGNQASLPDDSIVRASAA